MHLGTYWLVRIGIVMLLTGLVFFGNYAYQNFIVHFGPAGKVLLLYLASGALMPRSQAGSVLTDAAEAAEQALRIARDGFVIASDGSRLSVAARTLCLHGDTPVYSVGSQLRAEVLGEEILFQYRHGIVDPGIANRIVAPEMLVRINFHVRVKKRQILSFTAQHQYLLEA